MDGFDSNPEPGILQLVGLTIQRDDEKQTTTVDNPESNDFIVFTDSGGAVEYSTENGKVTATMTSLLDNIGHLVYEVPAIK